MVRTAESGDPPVMKIDVIEAEPVAFRKKEPVPIGIKTVAEVLSASREMDRPVCADGMSKEAGLS